MRLLLLPQPPPPTPRPEAPAHSPFPTTFRLPCRFPLQILSHCPHSLSTPPFRPLTHAATDILPPCEDDERAAAELAAAALQEDADTHLSSQEIIDADARLFVPTYARSPVVFVKGHGCKLFDPEGKEYLDMSAGIAVNALGHGDEAWVKAVAEQAALLAHVSNIFHSEPQVKLAKRLVDSCFADRVFFSNSGTEANEAALKFARKYQRHKLEGKTYSYWFKFGQQNPPTGFVAFTNSFHGRTIGSLALTSKEKYREPFEPVMPGVQFVEFGNLEAAQRAIQQGKTAAVFVEPIQGEGGIHAAVLSFLRGLRKCCDETGALLVFDEVQCGLGRTGRLWAHEHYGVQPDIMTVAKPLAGGLPIGAVLVTEAVASTISFGDHGSTFAGGPLVCHAALTVLDRIEEPGFLETVAAKGQLLRALLTEKLGNNPHVKEVRGMGLLVGVELDVPAAPLVKAALENGLLILTAGQGNIVRLVPPLIITEKEIEEAVEIISKCMGALGALPTSS